MTAQVFVNGLVAASFYAVIGSGFAFIYQSTRFFAFSHAAMITVGAYGALAMSHWDGIPLWISVLTGLACSGMLGLATEFSLYRQLTKRGASPMVLLLASIGTYVVLQNFISIVFGDQTQTLRDGAREIGLPIMSARVTSVQLATIVVAPLLIGILALLKAHSRVGCIIRATASDPQLAITSGIRTEWVRCWVFLLGSILAGAAGILIALDVDITPGMGMTPFLYGVVCAVIAGLKNDWRILLAALLLGQAQHVGAWYLGARWQDSVAFVALAFFVVAWQFIQRIKACSSQSSQ